MTLKELQEKRLTLAANVKTLADKANAEPANWGAEDEGQWKRVNDEFDANETALTVAKAAIDKAAEIQARAAKVGELAGEAIIGPAATTTLREPQQVNADRDRYLALQAWLVAGSSDPRARVTQEQSAAAQRCQINLQSRGFDIELSRWNAPRCHARWDGMPLPGLAQSSQIGVDGGFTFGESFVNRLEVAKLAFGGVMNVAEIIRTASGEIMRWPTANDTMNTGRMIGENAAVVEKKIGIFGQKTWSSYKFTSDEVLVPFELLRDSAFDLASIIADMLGERLGRIEAQKYTTGSGASEPTGIVTAATLGVTAASATAIAFDELMDLEHSIDPARRGNGCGYMFHDNVLLALKKLKNGFGDYLWKPGVEAGAPNTLNTYPYQISMEMASAIAASAKTVLFGQLTAFKIREVGSIRLYRLVERYRENDQDAFLAFASGDSNLLDAGDHPVKYLQQHA